MFNQSEIGQWGVGGRRSYRAKEYQSKKYKKVVLKKINYKFSFFFSLNIL
jgi:hypothetical protein